MTDKAKTEQIHQYYIFRLESLSTNDRQLSTNHIEVELKNIHKFFHSLLDLTEKDVKEDYCVLASKKKDMFTQTLIPSK